MQCIIFFSNISNREIKRRFRSVDALVETSADVRRNYWCMHVSLDFLHLQKAVHGVGFLPHRAMLPTKVKVHVVNFRQAFRRVNNDEGLGTKQLSSITHPLVSDWGRFRCCKLTCHRAWISLWEHLLWKRALLVFGSFFIDMPFTNMVHCNSSMLQAVVEPYILPKMILLP